MKSASSIHNCTNNKIVYIESGLCPSFIQIKPNKIKFCLSLQELIEKDSKIILASKMKEKISTILHTISDSFKTMITQVIARSISLITN